MIGTIAHLVPEKGFGFIKCDEYETNLFFHAKDLRGVRIEELSKGQAVEFAEVMESDKGPRAQKVSVH